MTEPGQWFASSTVTVMLSVFASSRNTSDVLLISSSRCAARGGERHRGGERERRAYDDGGVDGEAVLEDPGGDGRAVDRAVVPARREALRVIRMAVRQKAQRDAGVEAPVVHRDVRVRQSRHYVAISADAPSSRLLRSNCATMGGPRSGARDAAAAARGAQVQRTREFYAVSERSAQTWTSPQAQLTLPWRRRRPGRPRRSGCRSRCCRGGTWPSRTSPVRRPGDAGRAPTERAAGSSDPYCLVTVTGARTGSKIRTKTIWKNLNPVWNEKYEFEIVAADKAEVQIEVWDEDYLSSDDFMGMVTIPLKDLQVNQVVDKWYTLQKKKEKDKIKGDIHISLHYYDAKVRRTTPWARPPAACRGARVRWRMQWVSDAAGRRRT